VALLLLLLLLVVVVLIVAAADTDEAWMAKLLKTRERELRFLF